MDRCCHASNAKLDDDATADQPAALDLSTDGGGGAFDGSTCTNTGSSSNPNDDYIVETGLAREMNALTVEEREQVYEEIHGIADVIEEAPELVSTSLHRMREDLAHVPRRMRIALDRAFFLKPGIANDDDFHMIFLRANRFDSRKAAYKMCRFFTHKLELFGDDKLVRDITLDDLGEQEMQYLYDGSIQFPVVNHHGLRAQYFMISACRPVGHDQIRAFLRYQFFQLMAVLEDEQVQKRGIVEISNCCGNSNLSITQMLEFGVKAKDFFNDRPVRICGFHILYDQSSFGSFLSSISKLMGADLILRQRFHFGSQMEILYDLLTFGIKLPESCLDLGEGSIFSRSHIESYLDERRQKEDSRRQILLERMSSTPGRTPCPAKQDVIMGRGRPYQKWPGNKRLAQLVQDCTQQYMLAVRKSDKTAIASKIVNIIQDQDGGKFIVRTSNDWEQVEDVAAREKVSQLLRHETRSRQSSTGICKDGIVSVSSSANEADSIEEDHIPLGDPASTKSKRRRFD